MVKIKYSKDFMDKFGGIVRSEKNKNFQKVLKPTGFNLYSYVIDSKFRKMVNLRSWLKSQIDDVFGDVIVAGNDWKNKPFDESIVEILNFVRKEYSYFPDSLIWDCDEKWATFKESFSDEQMRGDCEDGAIAIFVLARKVGIPEERIKLVAGEVLGGGHCWILYTTDDGVDVCIDWCYWYNNLAVSDRNDITEEDNYFNGRKVWFGVTDESMWVR